MAKGKAKGPEDAPEQEREDDDPKGGEDDGGNGNGGDGPTEDEVLERLKERVKSGDDAKKELERIKGRKKSFAERVTDLLNTDL